MLSSSQVQGDEVGVVACVCIYLFSISSGALCVIYAVLKVGDNFSSFYVLACVFNCYRSVNTDLIRIEVYSV